MSLAPSPIASQAVRATKPVALGAGQTYKLNLGGAGEGFLDGRIPGFLTVDLREGPDTDVVADCSSLKMFDDETVSEIYASNILEHWPHTQTIDVLKEWRRVLIPGGKLYISVPDFDVAVKLYLQEGLTEWLKFHLWGDQKHLLNFHYLAFTMASLGAALMAAGFSDCKKVPTFGFAEDGSTNVHNHSRMLISLNVMAIN